VTVVMEYMLCYPSCWEEIAPTCYLYFPCQSSQVCIIKIHQNFTLDTANSGVSFPLLSFTFSAVHAHRGLFSPCSSTALLFSHASSQEAFPPLSIIDTLSLVNFSSAAYLTIRSGASSRSIFITSQDLVVASGAAPQRCSYLS